MTETNGRAESEKRTARPRDPDDEWTGPISANLFRLDCQLAAVDVHAAAEGIDVDDRVVLESYDRTLHPWIHGRRPADLAETAREWLPGARSRGRAAIIQLYVTLACLIAILCVLYAILTGVNLP